MADSVTTHELWGGGSYIFTNVDPTIHADQRLRGARPAGRADARPAHLSLNQAGTIDHVINGVGAAVTPDRQGPENVLLYP